MVLLVGYQKVKPGKRAALDELNKQWDAFEARLGFPPQKQYACSIGGHQMGTLLLLREFDSMAAMEALFAKMMVDAEIEELMAATEELVESTQWELYEPSP
jgi:hypothetical protein